MYYPTTGTSAYKPQYDGGMAGSKKQTAKKTAAKSKAGSLKIKSFIIIAVLFVLAFAYVGRYVQIFGKHDTIIKMTRELESVKMANEQLSVEIKSLTDSSRIEQYATEHLNLKKMDSNQIIYLNQTTSDNMQRMVKERSSILTGIFGIFSGLVEYLN